MNPSAVAAPIKNMLNSYGRPMATILAGALGRSVGVQYGPGIVNWAVNRTVNGILPRFFLRNAAHAAIGTYYPLIGQLALGGAVAVCPEPARIAQSWTGYKFNRDYENQLKTFDPELLTLKATGEGWLLCDDLQKTSPIIEDDIDTESFEWVEDEAKNLPTPAQMGRPGVFEMDDLASVEGFEFIDN
ncbi:hypothetical protein [Endozoicomonas euniceicola]|uniref:Uncharacterized protein n=1 Tax=Endozoicomonas euniceicola TaxID=1234143 RepID=A0ABY6GWU1_9GAMM|nr:hypothetical protein [Endozoicomonas euniceicola]UYM17243.1 hypothetical protein NX720_04785 [Endozoicomonas euniceicola]